MQDVIDADIAELPVAEALSNEKVTTNLGDLCVFFNVFSVPYLYNQPWLLFSQIETCAATMVEREMEEMMECPEFQVKSFFLPYRQSI